MIALLGHVPWVVVCGWLAANLIPYLSALATRAPSWSTGAVTVGLSLLDGIVVEVAQGNLDWQAVLGTAFVSAAIAGWHHSKVLKGTPVEAALYAVGTKTKPTPHPRPGPTS
jgi:hypothetical protein